MTPRSRRLTAINRRSIGRASRASLQHSLSPILETQRRRPMFSPSHLLPSRPPSNRMPAVSQSEPSSILLQYPVRWQMGRSQVGLADNSARRRAHVSIISSIRAANRAITIDERIGHLQQTGLLKAASRGHDPTLINRLPVFTIPLQQTMPFTASPQHLSHHPAPQPPRSRSPQRRFESSDPSARTGNREIVGPKINPAPEWLRTIPTAEQTIDEPPRTTGTHLEDRPCRFRHLTSAPTAQGNPTILLQRIGTLHSPPAGSRRPWTTGL